MSERAQEEGRKEDVCASGGPVFRVRRFAGLYIAAGGLEVQKGWIVRLFLDFPSSYREEGPERSVAAAARG